MIIKECQYCLPNTYPAQFCHKPVKPGKSYCEEHYPLMYRVGTAIAGNKRKLKELERKIKYIKTVDDEVYTESSDIEELEF